MRVALLFLLLTPVTACGQDGGPPVEPSETQAALALDADVLGLPSYLRCLRNEGVALISAHRGGPEPGYPENAIETFAHVAGQASALFEVDVRATADGVMVLMHDRDLDRTTTCEGRLDAITMEALRACRLEDNDGGATDFVTPTLVDALGWAKDRGILQLDVKDRQAFPAVVEIVKQADAFDRVVFITYTLEVAAQVAALHPDAVISTTIRQIDDLETLADAGLGLNRLIAWVGLGELQAELVADLDARGVAVNFGTLGFSEDSLDNQIARSGEEGRYRDFTDVGVDIIATDRPLAAYRALVEANDPGNEIATCNGF